MQTKNKDFQPYETKGRLSTFMKNKHDEADHFKWGVQTQSQNKAIQGTASLLNVSFVITDVQLWNY